MDFCTGAVHRAIHALGLLIEDHAQNAGLPARYAATKLIEGDPQTIELLKLNQNELETRDHIIEEMEDDLHLDKDAALADMRYNFIEKVVAETVTKQSETKEQLRSYKIDRIVTNKYLPSHCFL
jgi:ferrous iron transport protein B